MKFELQHSPTWVGFLPTPESHPHKVNGPVFLQTHESRLLGYCDSRNMKHFRLLFPFVHYTFNRCVRTMKWRNGCDRTWTQRRTIKVNLSSRLDITQKSSESFSKLAKMNENVAKIGRCHESVTASNSQMQATSTTMKYNVIVIKNHN